MTSQSTLNVLPFTLGDWQTNCYLTYVEGSRNCWLIDAGFGPQPMIDAVRERGLEPSMLILTHAHLDHIAGVHEVRQAFPDLPIAIHSAEQAFLTDPKLNLSAAIGMDLTAPPADRLLEHGETLMLDGLSFEIRHTPGHSPGGISLYQPDSRVAFVGDALFAGSIGRTDFPTSDHDTLISAIREQLLSLPDDVQIFPGHMGPSTIGHERQANPFLQ
ncbi:MAG: MBL fold metallo-hydrolase [Phycisphaeraceae bacterium]